MEHHRLTFVTRTMSISLTTAMVAGAASTPVKSVCPGAIYKLSVSFTETREALVTSTYGNMSKGPSVFDTLKCKNRFIYNVGQDSNYMTSMLSLPCASAMPALAVVISVTSANNQYDYYHQSSATFPVDTSCGVGTCTSPPLPVASPSLSPHSVPSPPQFPPPYYGGMKTPPQPPPVYPPPRHI
ncbi:hypothetical protein CEUSTIGMA_g616.t1 [Chlamydomonas eustigma]|uniref:Pherophorin domain-containing protein n=1 Tax=Chlamydomonas eustigma TaxID=1157962 RepID=A0A250WQS3_9CHLO|nr:hypothetical protein CEUSTIGMA_g616.t1 [Chlamydomonas eustigma]|eukprot:GAX73163.1 hypothetical protein CEUSTIGMA_g616.t1 [Chlamydomonas eustigma]